MARSSVSVQNGIRCDTRVFGLASLHTCTVCLTATAPPGTKGPSNPTNHRWRRNEGDGATKRSSHLRRAVGISAEADGNRTRQGTFAPSSVLKTEGPTRHPDASRTDATRRGEMYDHSIVEPLLEDGGGPIPPELETDVVQRPHKAVPKGLVQAN